MGTLYLLFKPNQDAWYETFRNFSSLRSDPSSSTVRCPTLRNGAPMLVPGVLMTAAGRRRACVRTVQHCPPTTAARSPARSSAGVHAGQCTGISPNLHAAHVTMGNMQLTWRHFDEGEVKAAVERAAGEKAAGRKGTTMPPEPP